MKSIRQIISEAREDFENQPVIYATTDDTEDRAQHRIGEPDLNDVFNNASKVQKVVDQAGNILEWRVKLKDGLEVEDLYTHESGW